MVSIDIPNKKELLDRIEIKKFSEPFSKVNIEVIDKENLKKKLLSGG